MSNNIDILFYGRAGKLNEIGSDIVFGTDESKVVFVDNLTNEVDFIDIGASKIISEVVKLDSSYFAIDLNGLLIKFSKDGTILSSITLEPSSNLLVIGDYIIVPTNSGKIYYIDSDLNIINSYELNNSAIIAKPIFYNGSLYTVLANGEFYKDSTLVGTFNTKVSNINLINDYLIFGGENGSIWRVDLE